MNILIRTQKKPVSTTGGTEHASISTAKALAEFYGWSCYAVYDDDEDLPLDKALVDGHQLSHRSASELMSYAERINASIILIQGERKWVRRLRGACSAKGIKLVYAHHSEPGWELVLDRGKSVRLLKSLLMAENNRERFAYMIRFCANPIREVVHKLILPHAYNATYHNADAVVLLSDSYFGQFKMFAKLDDLSKLHRIPNTLPYERFATLQEINDKNKDVLLVTRMDENQKRISLALDVWKKVKQSGQSKGWRLVLVGNGRDLAYYKRRVKEEEIADICFLGRQEPEKLYVTSSIFLMTSVSEGMPLTLLEAQQFGCVPVAFDSFASVRDIIEDGSNGMLFPYGDITSMSDGVLSLMRDDRKRASMAVSAVESSRRFARDATASMWYNLFSRLSA